MDMNESVGNKIVEALKRQAETDIASSAINSSAFQASSKIPQELNKEPEIKTVLTEPAKQETNVFGDIFGDSQDQPTITSPISQQKSSITEDSFDNLSGFGEPIQQAFSPINEPTTFEMPSNIVVLKKLISQLPSGVSRHTGAQIIKQTMEALGISMRSVLQDAQQVQENLKNSAKECQSYIQEYKKQIVSLEKQSQNYQKQYAALNDLISLFIQANK